MLLLLLLLMLMLLLVLVGRRRRGMLVFGRRFGLIATLLITRLAPEDRLAKAKLERLDHGTATDHAGIAAGWIEFTHHVRVHAHGEGSTPSGDRRDAQLVPGCLQATTCRRSRTAIPPAAGGRGSSVHGHAAVVVVQRIDGIVAAHGRWHGHIETHPTGGYRAHLERLLG